MKMTAFGEIQSSSFRVVFVIAVLSLVPVATLSLAESDQAAKGQQVYQDKKCALCHAIQGNGGKAGGDLSKIGAKRDADWIKRFLMAPKSVIPTAKMPSLNMNIKLMPKR